MRQQQKQIRDIATEEQQAHKELGRRVKQHVSRMALDLPPSKLSLGAQESASQEDMSRAREQSELRGQPATESPSESVAAKQSLEFHVNFQRAMADRLRMQQMLDSTRICAETLEEPRAPPTDTAASLHYKEAGQPLLGGQSKWGSDERGVWLGVTPAVGPAQIESLKHLERQLVHAGDGLIESRRQVKEGEAEIHTLKGEMDTVKRKLVDVEKQLQAEQQLREELLKWLHAERAANLATHEQMMRFRHQYVEANGERLQTQLAGASGHVSADQTASAQEAIHSVQQTLSRALHEVSTATRSPCGPSRNSGNSTPSRMLALLPAAAAQGRGARDWSSEGSALHKPSLQVNSDVHKEIWGSSMRVDPLELRVDDDVKHTVAICSKHYASTSFCSTYLSTRLMHRSSGVVV